MKKTLGNQPNIGENESSRPGAETPKTALTTRAAKDSDDMADSDSTKSPAFRFYPNDFITGTLTFTTEEVGAYLLLLCHCWDIGSIPDDIHVLSRITRLTPTRMRRLWPLLSTKFKAVEGRRFVQPRLEREREKQATYRQRQSDAAAKRWQSRGNATASAPAMPEPSHADASSFQSSSSLSSSASARRENPRTLPERAGAFSEWYADTHERLFSVGYIGNPQKDYQTCLQLCEKFSDQDLRDAALVWFGQDDNFATSGTRTIPKFASRASHCVQLARKVGA